MTGGSQVKRYTAKAQARPGFRRIGASWWDPVGAVERRIVHLNPQDQADGLDAADAAATEHLAIQRAQTEEEAQSIARARGQALTREKGALSIEIPGNPMCGADMTLVVIGVRPGSADGIWRIKNATHTIGSSGYSTSLQAELPGPGNQEQGERARNDLGPTLAVPAPCPSEGAATTIPGGSP